MAKLAPVKIACTGSDELKLASIQPFQGELKELSKDAYESLKNEILKTGFAFPFHVWKKGKEIFLIGGHQRLRVLQMLERMGHPIPKLPVVYIEAKDYKEAKRRVLQDAAQYGKITDEGLYQFVVDAQINPADLSASFVLPDFNIPNFIGSYFPAVPDEGDVGAQVPPGEAETGRSMSNDVKMVQLYFDAENYAKFTQFCKSLGEHFKTDNITDTVFRAMEWQYGNS